jgi:integrator complex subunit 11
VLGACMFHVECNGESVVYTGDYNMTADRHLGAAWIDKLRPDVVLTETTYATTIRDSKRSREREFLRQVHQTLDKGGKVLIPVFALGRAQELCILLETYWNRTGLQYPIYFSGGLTEKANFYYKLFINWTNEKIKKTFIKRNMFDFSHVRPYDATLLKSDQPMVFFATPGMLHGGLSLQTFKEWAGNEKNAVIIPGYCMAGTVGNKILSGEKKITIDDKVVNVKMQVYNMSFSAHADSKGIMELLSHLEARNVILVHGEKEKMRQLSLKIKEQLKVPCFYPPNYSVTKIVTEPKVVIYISASLVNRVNKMYQDGALQYYRANSQMFVPQCLIVSKGDELELTDMTQGEQFTFENKWTSGPLKAFTSSSLDSFRTSLLAILTVEIIRQKKACLGVEWLMFDHEEQVNSRDLAKSIMFDYVEFDRDTH